MHKYCGTLHVLVQIMPVFWFIILYMSMLILCPKKQKQNKSSEEYVKPYEAACFCFADLFRGQN